MSVKSDVETSNIVSDIWTLSLSGWATRNASLLCLWTIIVCGFWLRFLHLGTPSLWWNEQLVPLTARFPISYIFDWTRLCEIHPPYLYVFTKFVMLMDDSDFALRLFPALTGVAAIPIAYIFYKNILGEPGALIFAALIAVNPLHLFLSRQLRPYAPYMMIFLLKLPLYYALFERSSTKRQATLFVCNMLLFSLNYITFLLVFCETLILAFGLMLRSTPWFRTSFIYGVLSVTASIPVLWSFLSRSSILTSDLNLFSASVFITVASSLDNMSKALYFFDNTVLKIFLGCLSIAGYCFLWNCRKNVVAVSISLIVIPLCVLILAKYGYDFRPWNSVHMIPLLLLPVAYFCACALRTLNLARVFAGALAVFGLFFFPTYHGAAYYNQDSGIEGSITKPLAKQLASFMNPGEPTAILDSGLSSALRWYLAKWFHLDPLAKLYVGPERDEMLFTLVGYRNDAPQDHVKILKGFTYDYVNTVRMIIPFSRPSLRNLPVTLELKPDPYSVFLQASELRDVAPEYGGGYQFIPTRHHAPATILYEIDNTSGPAAQQLAFDLRFLNHGVGNTFSLQGRFDEENWHVFVAQNGPTEAQRSQFTLRRFTPYKRLSLRVSMNAEPVTPSYPGDNLGNTAFQGLELKASPLHGDFFNPIGLDPTISATGLRDVESDQNQRWRWAVGPVSQVSFDAPPGHDQVTLRFAVNNPIPDQTIDVLANGIKIIQLKNLPSIPWMRGAERREVTIPVMQGKNTIDFVYSMQNGNGFTFNEKDTTPYATAFTQLEIEF